MAVKYSMENEKTLGTRLFCCRVFCIFTSGFACAGNILVSNDYVSMRKQRPACKRKWNKVLLEKSFKIERHVMNRQRLKSR